MIMLFDGYCNLCDSTVQFVLRRDPHRRVRFAAQQYEVGQRLLAGAGAEVESGESIVVVDGAQVLTRSTAVLAIARVLRAPWPLLYGLILVPRPLRDAACRALARHRYRWFGRRTACRLPTAEDRERFVE
ncbi:MAG: DCC1-like thiol-disulfide oxidoreductase family protein [Lentisphaerae bacterium]|nr:DCC1-like thiol-disulfide oxidoreductase family protein [Lentisphaerota bacterium]